jgi:hypothetical protein
LSAPETGREGKTMKTRIESIKESISMYESFIANWKAKPDSLAARGYIREYKDKIKGLKILLKDLENA